MIIHCDEMTLLVRHHTHAEKPHPARRKGRRAFTACIAASSALAFFSMCPTAYASIAYGTINNFDCVNDTGVEAHGFEIELDGGRSKDITYTYDYNHYGVPAITEDLTNPSLPKVFVRYASAKKPDGTWAAYTAIPSGPIAPTQGHQFTNPSINFGGEHFGVGYYGTPSAVKYNWLIDDGTGKLVHGPPVNVATPTFTYYPPVAANPPAVVAVVVPPPPPAPPPLQFGDASWVKEIKTTTHNAGKVHLEDLVGDDPGKPQPWANGEPAEVEVEWRVLQTEFAAPKGGKNGELAGAPEDLPNGNEVITRRYEFYKYVGPRDAETGEAVGDAVGPDGIHGIGNVTYADHFDPGTGEWVTVTTDMSTVVVVGDFFGAQMSGFDVAPELGLINNIQAGDVNVPFPDRTVVVAGGGAFLASVKSGSLPDGLHLDPVTGVLSGTPTVAGDFTFTVEASDTTPALVSKTYTVKINGPAAPATFTISTSASPAAGGATSGDGVYNNGDSVTVTATANAGYEFVNWTEGGVAVSALSGYTFMANADRTLVANFAPIPAPDPPTAVSAAGADGQITLTWTASAGATSYNVYRSAVSNGEAAPATYGAASSSYVDTAVTNGITYYYKVTAVNASGESGFSKEVSAVAGAPIITAATATPNPVTGTATLLWANATDAAGRRGVTYHWSQTSGPVQATLDTPSHNSTKATFTQAGVYVFTVMVTDKGGASASAVVNVPVNQTATNVVVTPAVPAVALNGTLAFTATVSDQFGDAIAGAPIVWSVKGGVGAIDGSGVYSAGPIPGYAWVRAASGGRWGQTFVTVNNDPPAIIGTATASPSPVTGVSTFLSVTAIDAAGARALSYSWLQTAGPSPATIQYASRKGTNVTFIAPGTYTFQVTVTNTSALTAISTVTVDVLDTVKSVSVTPGPVQTVPLNTAMPFGAIVIDQFGNTVPSPSVVWSVITGVGSVDGTGLYSSGPVPGSAILRASVGTISGAVRLVIPDGPPSITAGPAASPVVGRSAVLSVSATDAAGARALSYSWAQTGGAAASINAANKPSTRVVFPAAGSYTFQVTVTNKAGLSVAGSVTVVSN